MHHDSLYATFLEKATLRFNKGESNILEKTTAETQQGQISIQLNQLQHDIEIAQLQFQILLNTTTILIPGEPSFKMNLMTGTDTSLLIQHPGIQLLQQQKQIALANTQLQKSKLLPDLNLSYYNTSIKGTGADNKTYGSSTRFNSVEVGVGIPLLNGSQKAKINASKTSETIAENSYKIGLQNLQSAYETALLQYQKYLQTVNYYETRALKNAGVITSTANRQFLNGDINYLDWVILTNQAITIESQYIDAIKNLNEAVFQLNYLTNK